MHIKFKKSIPYEWMPLYFVYITGAATAKAPTTSTSFQKINIGWPQQPPTEKVSDISKKWIFDDPFHRKGPVLILLVPGIIQPSRSGSQLIK